MIMLILNFLGACIAIYLGLAALIWTCIAIGTVLVKIFSFEFKPSETEDQRREKLGYFKNVK